MARSFANIVLEENPTLFRMIYQFNCQVANTIHPDHLEGLVDHGVFECILQSPRGEQALSEWIVEQFALEPDGVWDFESQVARLVLLDSSSLVRLIKLAGIASIHRQIARIVDRDTVSRIKQSLTEELYLFAVKRAGFLLGPLADALDTGEPTIGPEEIDRQAGQVGQQLVSACLTGQPKALMSRLALKLPADIILNDSRDNSENSHAIWPALKRILLTEVNPEFAVCFN